MAIYDSTPSSSLLNYLLSSAVPTRHRVRLTSQMESMVNSSTGLGSSGSSANKFSLIPWNKSRQLGYTLSMGIFLLLIAVRNNNNNRKDRLLDSEDGSEGSGSETTSPAFYYSSLYQIVFEHLTRLRDFFISSRSGEDYDREEGLDGETFVVHQGSCHCGSIAFEVSAPFVLQVEELAGKLLYPSVRVPESSFRLLRGEEVWQTYHVPDEHKPATQAFSFCRKCAVHLVHAIDSEPFMVSFNVHCLTTPWKKAKGTRHGNSSAFRRVSSRSKKRSAVPRSPGDRSSANQAARGITNSQNRGTPNSRGESPPPFQSNTSSPISFDSKLTESPTPPDDDNQSFKKADSLSVASDNYSFGNSRPPVGEWRDEADPNPFQLRPKPHRRYNKNASSSVSDWPTDNTTETSSYLYADDENSLYESSVTSAHTEPLPPPTVGGTPRSAGISSNYALRQKLRSNLSKHMKDHKVST